MQTIPITQINYGDRIRQDMGDIDDLAKSIQDIGLIQPVVLDETNTLVAGGRRLLAAQKAGLTEIPFVLRETGSSKKVLRKIELEENLHRKDMDWKERCRLIADYHQFCLEEKASEGDYNWAGRQTAALLGISHAATAYSIQMAEFLKDPTHPIQKADSLRSAWQILRQLEEDRVNREIVARSISTNVIPVAQVATPIPIEFSSLETFLSGEAPPKYGAGICIACGGSGKNSSGDTCPICKGGVVTGFVDEVVKLNFSQMFFNGSVEDLLPKWPDASVDHIITDPPYGIDMAYLNQQHPQGGMVNLDRVEEEHDVEANLATLKFAIPHFYRILRPNSFMLLWYDNVHWHYLRSLAESAGFKVQRWPLVWCKTSACLNQCAQTNWTKATEMVFVARKGVATLLTPQSSNYKLWGATDKTQFSHPFAKPPELWEWLIQAVASPAQVILDPFAGCGSSIWAVAKSGRQPRAIEVKPEHYNQMIATMQTAYASWFAPRKVEFV